MAGYEITKLRAENEALRKHLQLNESAIRTLNRLNLEFRNQIVELVKMLSTTIEQRNRNGKGE